MSQHPSYVYMKYQCKVCNIHSPSKVTWKAHLATKKHRSNVAELVEIVPDTDVMKALREENEYLKHCLTINGLAELIE